MIYFVSTIHVLLCIFMIFVILLQPGKDAGMGAALGGGAATSAFGGRGAVTFLGKVTAVCATAFFLTSLGLSFVGLKSSVTAGEPSVTDTQPANPPAGAATPPPAAPAVEAQKAEEAVKVPPAPAQENPGNQAFPPPAPNPK